MKRILGLFFIFTLMFVQPSHAVFKHKFFDIDYRNTSVSTQKDVIDAFFQAHTIEFWDIGENEVLFGVYDENNTAGATRFTFFDAGADGIKGNISGLNTNNTLINFSAANKIIKMIMLEDRILLIQYEAR